MTLKRIGFFCFRIKHSTHTRTVTVTVTVTVTAGGVLYGRFVRMPNSFDLNRPLFSPMVLKEIQFMYKVNMTLFKQEVEVKKTESYDTNK